MKNTLNYFKLLKNMNWPMAVAVIVLLVTGVFFVYSSCYVSEEHPVRTLYKRQVVWALAGLLCYLVLTMNDYRQLSKIAWWGYAATIFLLILVPFIGKTIYGAKRWLMLFGDNGIGIQPSELAKLATIFVLAKRLSRPELDLKKIQTFFITLLIVFVPVLLVMKQPDLGTAMVFLPTAFVIMFSAGVPFRFLGTILAIGITIVALLLSALILPQALGANESTQKRVRAMTGLSEYQHGRIQVFFNPETDPLGAGWNKRQSEIAVGSGGITGKGFRKGTQNILGFLPRSVAPTDFIFSVIAEEKGFTGSVVVIGLFAVVILSGIVAALKTKNRTGRLLCVGLSTLIFCHVFINIAMTVGLMPITGLPLPLLSYGGTFMITMMSALGIIQSVYIRSYKERLF